MVHKTAGSYRRILEPPAGSFFLFGPRGSGKSTWIATTLPDAHVIDLLDEALYQSYLADIGRFAAELRALKAETWVVVDEVQRLPELLNEVHRHIEQRGLKFALCGSSARKLKRSGTNLLAGRAVRRNMHPFLPEELGKDFEINDVLRFGTLPVVWSAANRSDALEAYAQLYLKEEIQAEALVRNLPGFARFLPLAALFHGQVLNVAGLARDAGVARTTIADYLSITEDTLLTFQLPAFTPRMRAQERKHGKLYWVDPGLVRALKRQYSGDPSAEERGALFEGWIATVLRAYRDYRRLFDDWYYWASAKAKAVEVDFLLERAGEFCAIEVKASKAFTEGSQRGLKAVADLPGLRRRILVYLGERRMRTQDGIDVLPVRDFLYLLETGYLFDDP